MNNSYKRKAVDKPHEKPAKLIRKKLANFVEENGISLAEVSLICRNLNKKLTTRNLPKPRAEVHVAVDLLNVKTNRNELFLYENYVDNDILIFILNASAVYVHHQQSFVLLCS